MLTDRPMVKVNYILGAQNNGSKYFEILIPKNKKKRTKKTEDMGENVKNIIIAKSLLK